MLDRRSPWRLSLSVRQVLLWYVFAVSLAGAGSLLAYTICSSDAWRFWDGPTAWRVDLRRAVVAALLAMFALWNLRVVPGNRISVEDLVLYDGLTPREWSYLGLIVVLLGAATFTILPLNFFEGLVQRHYFDLPRIGKASRHVAALGGHAASFANIEGPYRAYLLYELGFWVGIVTPVGFFIRRTVHLDLSRWREAKAELERAFPLRLAAPSIDTLDAGLLALQNYTLRLKAVAERYVPLLLTVVIALAYEQLSASHRSVTPAAVAYAQVLSWFLLGPAVVVSVVIVAFGYQGGILRAERGLRAHLTSGPPDHVLLERVLGARTELMWERSTASFVLSIIKSAGIAIPLLAATIAYGVKALGPQIHWTELLFPEQVRAFIRGVL